MKAVSETVAAVSDEDCADSAVYRCGSLSAPRSGGSGERGSEIASAQGTSSVWTIQSAAAASGNHRNEPATAAEQSSS